MKYEIYKNEDDDESVLMMIMTMRLKCDITVT